MTTCLLVRHSSIDRSREYLVGRSSCALSKLGKVQSEALARRLPLEVDAVESSPRLRCVETITPYVGRAKARLTLCPSLDEIDYGAWTGRSFSDLANDPSWQRWNDRRSDARPEAGESMLEAQKRILDHLRSIGVLYARTVIAVTHAELIRAVVLHCLSLPLEAWHTIDVPFASVTRVEITPSGQLRREEMVA